LEETNLSQHIQEEFLKIPKLIRDAGLMPGLAIIVYDHTKSDYSADTSQITHKTGTGNFQNKFGPVCAVQSSGVV